MRKNSTLKIPQMCYSMCMVWAVGEQVLQVTVHLSMHTMFIVIHRGIGKEARVYFTCWQAPRLERPTCVGVRTC